MHAVSSIRPGQVFSRVILPLVLFVAIIGGVAYVVQNLPSGGKQARRGDDKGKATVAAAPLMSFQQEKAVWDPDDETYIKEFEREQPGHYDFPFKNLHDGPLEVGLEAANCDCTRVEVCFLAPDEWKQYSDNHSEADKLLKWKPLTKSETECIVMPKEYHGIARVNWKSAKQPGEKLMLRFRLWYQPQGQLALRQRYEMMCPILTIHPIMFNPDTVKLGTVRDDVTAQFYGWSPTRTELKVELDPKRAEACYEYKIEPLTEAELPKLQQHLREQAINTRVKAGVRVNLTVHENTKDRHLDQGHFRFVTPLLLDGQELAGPAITGTVRGDVDVGGAEDQGKVNLRSFAASLGVKRVVVISADPKTTLTLEGVEPAAVQSNLKTKLILNKEKSSKDRYIWDLHIEVPPASMYGEFPEESSIILRSQNTQTRKIRVPLSGIAVQG